ncbi:MAG: hypothetical protein IPG89_00835 [Bacteroidetes bacterium]|nr:hypothetical protein [Bacteroidota bacterium]
MKYLFLLIVGVLFFGCKRQAYQNQDIKYMSGTWKIVKVTSEADESTSLYDDLGTFIINEDGTGSMEINSVDYNKTNPQKVSCIFTVVPIKGIDYSFDLSGLKVVDAQGKATSYLCNGGELHFRVKKQKRKKMTLLLDQLIGNIYSCVITGGHLNKGNILWFMEKQ